MSVIAQRIDTFSEEPRVERKEVYHQDQSRYDRMGAPSVPSTRGSRRSGVSIHRYIATEDRNVESNVQLRSVPQRQRCPFVIPISAFSQSLRLDRRRQVYDGRGVGNASNCGVPAKTRTLEERGRRNAADTETCRQFGGPRRIETSLPQQGRVGRTRRRKLPQICGNFRVACNGRLAEWSGIAGHRPAHRSRPDQDGAEEGQQTRPHVRRIALQCERPLWRVFFNDFMAPISGPFLLGAPC
jgi:hypothetical protein